MKSKLYAAVTLFASLVFSLLGKLPFRYLEKFVDAVFLGLTKSSPYFGTFHFRPKSANGVWTEENSWTDKVAVIIQGPLVVKDDFTLETVRLYKRSMPGAKIVVSTWCGGDSETIRKITSEDVHVIENEKPDVSGAANVNYQIVSTISGIKLAISLGATHVLKTRSDQRIYALGIIKYLTHLLDVFPVAIGNEFSFLSRIVGVNINTSRYRPYSYSDMFQFGLAEDLVKLWEIPLDSRSLSTADIWKRHPTIRQVSQAEIGETYIYIEYMKKIGRVLKFTHADHLSLIKNQFVIIDKESLDLFWNKYGCFEYRVCADPKYQSDRTYEKINFKDWISMFSGGEFYINESKLDEVESV